MKILLVGNAPEAMALLRALAHAHEHKITHCTDGARAIVDLLKKGYDWAIIDGHSVSGGETDIARIVRAMGPDKQEQPAASTPHRPKLACGVEWSKDGILQLHCCLHSLLKTDGTRQQPVLADLGEILFEYHAPCTKERRNG